VRTRTGYTAGVRVNRYRLLTVVAAAVGLLIVSPAPSTGGVPPTIVSIEFDDGTADHFSLFVPLLAKHRMHATFYVNSGRVGRAGYMTWDQLRLLQATGHEIGGHTVNHAKLTSLTTSQQRREVCNDRQALLTHGIAATDFAYPFGAQNASARAIVKECGYVSGRGIGGVGSRPYAESIPPLDAYSLRTVTLGSSPTTLSTLQYHVRRAEQYGGGWLQLVFHEVCNGCASSYVISPRTLDAFLTWLAPRAASGTIVLPVRDVMTSGSRRTTPGLATGG
jgi:peptidoglycan/xylan/chitin deacetylase (PgdA/CDA1 family)